MSTTVSHGAGIKAWELPRKLGAEDERGFSLRRRRPFERGGASAAPADQAEMSKEVGNPVAGLDPRL